MLTKLPGTSRMLLRVAEMTQLTATFSVSAGLRPALAQCADSAQNGMVPGRQLADNIIDLDSSARCYGLSETVTDPAVLLLWDFAAAFPSLAHAYIFLALQRYGAPQGFLCLCAGLYSAVLDWASLDGTLKMWDTSEPGGGPRSLYIYIYIYI